MPESLRTACAERSVGAIAAECLVHDPEGQFAALAAELCIIKPGDRLDRVQIDFAYGVAELCAAVGDRYGGPSDGNAGEHIQALYGPM